MFQSSREGHERAKLFEDLGCLEDEMQLPNRDPNGECASLMFSMSAVIHDGAQGKVSFVGLDLLSILCLTKASAFLVLREDFS